MQRSKQIELLNQLKAELVNDPNIIINVYREIWMLIENKKLPGYFVYMAIGDWVKPHTAIIYQKLNCFEKRQRTYPIERGCGNNLEPLIDFAKTPIFENQAPDGESHYPTDRYNYLNELRSKSKHEDTKFDYLRHIAEERHGFILDTLQHIEMRPNRTETGNVLRFINETAFFDYDPDQEKIIASGIFPRETIDPTTDEPDPFNLLNDDEPLRYQLLSRMQADCDYYLGHGHLHTKHLWTQNEADQIIAMRLLWNSFPDDKKPEWLSLEQINDYATKMMVEV